jgi:hypothetical protein
MVERGGSGMSVEVVREALLWCAILNYGLLLVWFLLIALPHEWLYRLWGQWFRVPTGQFDTMNFAGIALYKVGILLFNVVPYLALQIVT